jgi:hypothetical protein
MTPNPPSTVGALVVRMGVLLFITYWGLGFAFSRIFFRHRSDSGQETTGYQQIKIMGAIRWFFGYKPVTGFVPAISFVLQLSALLTLITSLCLGLIGASLTDPGFLILMMLATSLLISTFVARNLLHKQRHS